MRFTLAVLLIVAFAGQGHAQTGRCTESAIKQGHLPIADNAFSYMPPYGKPVTGKSAMADANTKSFSDRINIKSSWVGEHRIGASPSGDMAYEHGTMHITYDTKGDGKHHEFSAVILNVYQAKGAVCQQVAGTMHPFEDSEKP